MASALKYPGARICKRVKLVRAGVPDACPALLNTRECNFSGSGPHYVYAILVRRWFCSQPTNYLIILFLCPMPRSAIVVVNFLSVAPYSVISYSTIRGCVFNTVLMRRLSHLQFLQFLLNIFRSLPLVNHNIAFSNTKAGYDRYLPLEIEQLYHYRELSIWFDHIPLMVHFP